MANERESPAMLSKPKEVAGVIEDAVTGTPK
jgi:hypothetical protein